MRQLQQRVVFEFMRIPKIRQAVFVAAVLAQRRHVLVKQTRLADQIEGVVGQRQVFFQNGPVSTPLGVALPQDQRVVGQVQHQGGYIC